MTCLRVLTRAGVCSVRARRRYSSGFLVRWLDRLFRLLSWGHGESSVNLPGGASERPAVIIVNRRSDLDLFAVGHFCRQLRMEDIRWVLHGNGFWTGLFSVVAGDLCPGGVKGFKDGSDLGIYVAASLECEDGASFVLFPESGKYDPANPAEGWCSVLPPRYGAFRRLCAALSHHDVITTSLLWRSAVCRSRHFVTILSERHEGLPADPGKWLRQQWRRVEATLTPFCD